MNSRRLVCRESTDLDLDQIAESCDLFSCASGESGVALWRTMMTTLKTMTMAAVLLVGGASLATAQNGLPTGGQLPVAGGAGGGGYPGYGYGYGYAGAPLYDYAAPAYGYAAPAYSAPATAGTTVVIIMRAPAYSAPAMSGYYGAPSTVVSQPIYNYAPGYAYGYTPGYWNRGYWGGYGYGWR
jgi:hypothetical protein